MATLHGCEPLRVPGRDRHGYQHDPALRQGTAQAAGGRCGAARTLAHHDLCGGPARERDHRTARGGRAHAGRDLQFKAYVEQMLAPALSPGDVVVLDNLAAHKVAGVEEAIRGVGASPLYLPPYSPDLNPIEQLFAKLEALLREAGARTKEVLWTTIEELLDAFEPNECRNYIRNCGYEPV
ncbi:transposase [Microvirga arabica]|uniref:Transposase n=1 Tax=Microvirga arabica TaxID=1128671 RepID=A0ABV6Y9V2_9HYPH